MGFFKKKRNYWIIEYEQEIAHGLRQERITCDSFEEKELELNHLLRDESVFNIEVIILQEIGKEPFYHRI